MFSRLFATASVPWIVFLGSCATSAGEVSTSGVSDAAASGIQFTNVSEGSGPVGKFCRPPSPDPTAALVVIGGSAGGLNFAEPTARLACENGYAALALAYWGYGELPKALEEIPLEYFDRSIEWLTARPDVDLSAVGLIGYSRGGEAALLIASRNEAIAAVAALVPGSHVGPSIDFSDFFDLQSAWSVDGEPLPFVTTRPDRPGANWQEVMKERPRPSPTQARADFETLQALPGAAAAAIPVDDIDVPVFLIGAGQDSVWASTSMVNFVSDQLDTDTFEHELQATYYGDAGHSFMLDSLIEEEGDQAGMAAWHATFSFFDRYLMRDGTSLNERSKP